MASKWVAAHTWNTIRDTGYKNGQQGINYRADALNVWISSRVTQNAPAPMIRAIFNTSLISKAIDYFLGGAPGAKQILQKLLPDITLRYGKIGGTTQSTP